MFLRLTKPCSHSTRACWEHKRKGCIKIMKDRVKQYILIGLAGALITVVGEMLQGAVPSANTADRMNSLFASFDNLSLWRIGVGSTVGALGILLQFFGVYAIYMTFRNKKSKTAGVYYVGMLVFSVLGAIVHVLMSFMIYAYKISMEAMMEVTIWFVLPPVILFLAGYIPFSIAMFIQFRKEQTSFPRWMCWLNPLFGKMFINAVANLLPSGTVVNGIAFSNMGLSSVLLFSVMLCTMGTSSPNESEG